MLVLLCISSDLIRPLTVPSYFVSARATAVLAFLHRFLLRVRPRTQLCVHCGTPPVGAYNSMFVISFWKTPWIHRYLIPYDRGCDTFARQPLILLRLRSLDPL